MSKKIGDEGYSGSIAKKGEMSAVVIGTVTTPSSAAPPAWWRAR